MADTVTKETKAAAKANAGPKRFPRTVLTDGAVFHKDWLHPSVTQSPEGDHQVCGVGDLVMLTDEEFDAHRAGGVCLVDAQMAQAAE
jgi:hypothetical protein